MRKFICLALIALPLLSIAQSADTRSYSVLDGKVSLSAPAALRTMTAEEYAYKYRNHSVPALALTDDLLAVNLIVQPMDQPLKQDQLADFTAFQLSQIKKKRTDAEILGNGVKTIHGRKVGWIKFVVKASDQKVYNHIFFTDADGKSVLFNFNCVEVKQAQWAPLADAIMASLQVK